MVYVKADVSEEVHRWLKTEAARYDMTVEEVVTQVINENSGEIATDGTERC